MHEGGCSCGAVRYQLSAVERAYFCHCRRCQRGSGAPVGAWAEAAAGALAVEGEVSTFDAGTHGVRAFCPRCGSVLSRRIGDRVSVALGSLDDPDAVQPTLHLCVAEQRRWMRPWDGLPRLEGAAVPSPPPVGWRTTRSPGVTTASAVTLQPIGDRNRMAVCSLLVTGPQQRFVAPNVLTLLQQAHAAEETWLRAVCAGGVPVGLVLVQIPEEDDLGLPIAGQPFLWRFMIDASYQGMGFGRQGLQRTVDAMRARGADAMYLSCVEGQGSPEPFYARMGFVDTGKTDPSGEVVMRLPLSAP